MDRHTYEVEWHPRAAREFKRINDARVRKKILIACDLLRRNGPKIAMPHARKVQGANKLQLFELRPGGGQDLNRPLYAQLDGSTFTILALAPEANVDPQGFKRAIKKAEERGAADQAR